MAGNSKKISMIPAKVQHDRNVKLSEKKMKVAAYRLSVRNWKSRTAAMRHRWSIIPARYPKMKTGKMPASMRMTERAEQTPKRGADFNAMIQDAPCRKDRHDPYKVGQQVCEEHGRLAGDHPKTEGKNVAVVFEKEGINTLEGTGEILITILSSLAQEESRNISENIRWGVVRKFEKGKVIVNCTKFMGYTKNEDGTWSSYPKRQRS